MALCFHTRPSFLPFSAHHWLAGWLGTKKTLQYHQMCPPAMIRQATGGASTRHPLGDLLREVKADLPAITLP